MHEWLLLVSADGGMDRRHQQRGGDAFPADVAHCYPQLVRSGEQKVIVVAAHDASRTADAVDFQSRHAKRSSGKKLLLDLMRDFQFALQALFLFLLGDQLFQRLSHRVE